MDTKSVFTARQHQAQQQASADVSVDAATQPPNPVKARQQSPRHQAQQPPARDASSASSRPQTQYASAAASDHAQARSQQPTTQQPSAQQPAGVSYQQPTQAGPRTQPAQVPQTGQQAPQQQQSSTQSINQPQQPPDNVYFPEAVRPLPEEIIYSWRGPTRPFKERNRQYFTTVGTIVLLISLILFFAGQFLPIAVVLAVGFLTYVMSTIPPEDVLYQLTTYGVRVEDKIYYWDELGRYWFTEKHDDTLLHIEVYRFPQRITMVVQPGDRDVLVEILSEVLLQEKPEPTYYERISAWLQDKIPLDIES